MKTRISFGWGKKYFVSFTNENEWFLHGTFDFQIIHFSVAKLNASMNCMWFFWTQKIFSNPKIVHKTNVFVPRNDLHFLFKGIEDLLKKVTSKAREIFFHIMELPQLPKFIFGLRKILMHFLLEIKEIFHKNKNQNFYNITLSYLPRRSFVQNVLDYQYLLINLMPIPWTISNVKE